MSNSRTGSASTIFKLNGRGQDGAADLAEKHQPFCSGAMNATVLVCKGTTVRSTGMLLGLHNMLRTQRSG
jgi:hypothetical protein